MKNIKRILAGVAALLLFGMYIATLVFAFIDHPFAHTLFMASIICTIVIPVLIYAMMLILRLTENKDKKEN